jgi:hypothetical protein
MALRCPQFARCLHAACTMLARSMSVGMSIPCPRRCRVIADTLSLPVRPDVRGMSEALLREACAPFFEGYGGMVLSSNKAPTMLGLRWSLGTVGFLGAHLALFLLQA